jgi:hypothetical protein
MADMNEELTTFIVKELGKYQHRDTVIRKVCKKSGLTWKDAERLIVLVDANHRRTTIVRPTPPLLFLSIGILVLGIGLLAFNIHVVVAFFHKDMLSQLLTLQGASYQMTGLMIGMGMTVGGMIGLWRAFGAIFRD